MADEVKATADEEQAKPDPFLRSPGSAEWRPLEAQPTAGNDEREASEAEASVNSDKLKNMLLGALQMQHLVVLAGSGCSLAVGGPSMGALWNAVVGSPLDEQAKTVAASVGYDLDPEDNHDIEQFLSWIEAFLYVNRDKPEVTKFLVGAEKIILDKCSEFLKDSKLTGHQAFLHRLSRRRARDQRLKLFTTNYDLCFETAASDIGLVVLDGFSFTAPRRYDPRYFSCDIVLRGRGGDGQVGYLPGVFLLYKLHGSVHWARDDNGEIVEKPSPTGSEACLIYPARGKYQRSYTQPHLESMAQYLAAIREPNTCVLVAGFGFNDNHLSEPLLAAVKSNPHLRLIIVDYCPKQKVADGKPYWEELAQLSESGEDIWMIQSDFEAFAQMVPDLHSLTPAESLMKAVKGVVGGG